jgi:hypothetical protein
MTPQNTIFSLILAAIIVLTSYVLGHLARSLNFWTFIVGGALACAIVISLGFAWDHYDRTRSQL